MIDNLFILSDSITYFVRTNILPAESVSSTRSWWVRTLEPHIYKHISHSLSHSQLCPNTSLADNPLQLDAQLPMLSRHVQNFASHYTIGLLSTSNQPRRSRQSVSHREQDVVQVHLLQTHSGIVLRGLNQQVYPSS